MVYRLSFIPSLRLDSRLALVRPRAFARDCLDWRHHKVQEGQVGSGTNMAEK